MSASDAAQDFALDRAGGIAAPRTERAKNALDDIKAEVRAFWPLSSISVVGENAPLKEETLVCRDFASGPKGAKFLHWQSSVS